ncbi:Large-conductance mechanosensitive channel [Emticicia aquatica]|jgi:large conductance mechanosensitive channel|uniref:Large-conductance mechanosensitive channel n=1 Tax=Emticicia aquatica TaxID=1681835 RepID=A0ABN8EY73_9BACT|nr:large conductance mechanosensitive channel protein MscL [Emticicia aquatica]CAH0996768.1 Large-conductance mechanosensitive channel [Emticicia aquatica]
MLKEFKTFIAQGNVLDLAVGVIIGGAFGKIVTSLVDDLIMPIINLVTNGGVTGGIVLREKMLDAAGKEVPAIIINYGGFLSTILNFLIIAWVIFLVVKVANKAKVTDK